MRPVAIALLSASLCAPLFGSGEARAQGTTNDRAMAESLFRDARALVLRREWPEACAKFAESQRLDPKLGTLLHLATCHEHEGKLASAWIEFTEARALARRTNQPDREKIASARATALEPKLSRLVIEAVTPVPQITIELDGTALSSAVLGSPFPIDPGEHVVSASAPDHEPAVVKISVSEEGQVVRVRIPKLNARDLPAPASSAPGSSAMPTPSAAAPLPPEPPPSTPSQRTMGIVVGALGVASLAAGTVFGAVALSTKGDADALCSGRFCTQEGLDDHDRARSFAHLSTAGLALGVVGVGVGAALFFTAKSPQAAALLPSVSANGAGASLLASF